MKRLTGNNVAPGKDGRSSALVKPFGEPGGEAEEAQSASPSGRRGEICRPGCPNLYRPGRQSFESSLSKIVWDSPASDLPQALEQDYFDLVESPVVEEMEWLGPPRS